MFGNLSGPTLLVILGVIFVLALIIVGIVLAVVLSRGRTRQSELNDAYLAGLNARPSPPQSDGQGYSSHPTTVDHSAHPQAPASTTNE